MTVLGRGSGPSDAKIMLVGEVWGHEEERSRLSFMGESGKELNRMLHEAGVMRSEVFCTNVINARPTWGKLEKWIPVKKSDITPEHRGVVKGKFVHPLVEQGYKQLLQEIALVKPNLIIAAGSTALWALTPYKSILHWRGSLLRGDHGGKVLAVLHPAAIMRQWSLRFVTVNDLRRVRDLSTDATFPFPKWNFIIDPSFEKTIQTLEMLLAKVAEGPTWIDVDLETAAGHIKCCGLSWSRVDAICIPLMRTGAKEGNWSEDAEVEIVWRLYKLLTHPNCQARLQNGLYDAQYTYRHWHFAPNVKQDTMLSQHTLWPGLKKSLDFQASMYCEHYTQWKPEKVAQKEGG